MQRLVAARPERDVCSALRALSPSSTWSAPELERLIHGLAMAGGDAARVSRVVATRSDREVRSAVFALAEGIVEDRSKRRRVVDLEHSALVGIVLRHCGLVVPVGGERVGAGGAGKVAVRVVARSGEDAGVLRNLGYNPNVEVVLAERKAVWDVVLHLYKKWGRVVVLRDPEGGQLGVNAGVWWLGFKWGKMRGKGLHVVRLEYVLLDVRVGCAAFPSAEARKTSQDSDPGLLALRCEESLDSGTPVVRSISSVVTESPGSATPASTQNKPQRLQFPTLGSSKVSAGSSKVGPVTPISAASGSKQSSSRAAALSERNRLSSTFPVALKRKRSIAVSSECNPSQILSPSTSFRRRRRSDVPVTKSRSRTCRPKQRVPVCPPGASRSPDGAREVARELRPVKSEPELSSQSSRASLERIQSIFPGELPSGEGIFECMADLRLPLEHATPAFNTTSPWSNLTDIPCSIEAMPLPVPAPFTVSSRGGSASQSAPQYSNFDLHEALFVGKTSNVRDKPDRLCAKGIYGELFFAESDRDNHACRKIERSMVRHREPIEIPERSEARTVLETSLLNSSATESGNVQLSGANGEHPIALHGMKRQRVCSFQHLPKASQDLLVEDAPLSFGSVNTASQTIVPDSLGPRFSISASPATPPTPSLVSRTGPQNVFGADIIAEIEMKERYKKRIRRAVC